ncbi:unnamed protein product, partial [Rotaria sordida]
KDEKKISSIENTSNAKLITTIDNDRNTNSNNIEFSDESLRNEITVKERKTIDLFRITPNSTSSISITNNDNSCNSNETVSTGNHRNNHNTVELINESDQAEKIQSVRKKHGRILFQMKLINENRSQWILSRFAKGKYLQPVIATW